MKRATPFLAVVTLASTIPSFWQDSATITGTVTDSSGAVIPAALILVSRRMKQQNLG